MASGAPTGATARFLTLRRAAIVDAAFERLVGGRLPHHADPAASRLRVELLHDDVVEVLATHDVTGLLDYVCRLADARYRSGAELGELQTELNVLEEAMWARLLDEVPPASCADALVAVSAIVGRAKDALAGRYVELAAHGRAPALDVEGLFARNDRH